MIKWRSYDNPYIESQNVQKKALIVMRVFFFMGNKMYNVQWLVQILEKIQGVT